MCPASHSPNRPTHVSAPIDLARTVTERAAIEARVASGAERGGTGRLRRTSPTHHAIPSLILPPDDRHRPRAERGR